MPLATRKGGQCAFCAFKASESRLHSFRQNGSRSYSESMSPIPRAVRANNKKNPNVTSYQQKERDGRSPRAQGLAPEISFQQRGNNRTALTSTAAPEERKYGAKRFMADRRPPSYGMAQASTVASEDQTSGTRRVLGHRQPSNIRMAQAPIVPPELRASGTKRLFAPAETTYSVFGRLLLEQIHSLRYTLSYKEQTSVKAWGIHSAEDLEERIKLFEGRLRVSTKLAEAGKAHQEDNPLFFRLRNAFIQGSMKTLAEEMKYAFVSEVVTTSFSDHHNTFQRKLADLRYPLEWYPATRAMQRTIHLHVGPTNSGKTYHALQKLEAAKTGVYAGPLRLLAHEVYTRMNAKGKTCALVTGEERRIPDTFDPEADHMVSCTVEMVPLNAKLDVAVIDEIQMMGDSERGWAWTQAFLGVQAKEVHLCGELRTVPLITKLCEALGDKLVVHNYERLSPLKTESRSLNGDLRNLKKGDAIILFSRVAIHAMKADVERITGRRCAVVYGSLPPETRAQQAALFNDPDNDYDFLAASDAVGMGLNLSIKRVIFEATSKHDGSAYRLIHPSAIKQIAGRAGRYKTARDDTITKSETSGVSSAQASNAVQPSTSVGLVTSLEKFDLPIVQRAMDTEVVPLKSAGIFPPSDVLLRFAAYFPPKTPFSFVVLRLNELAELNPLFHVCTLKDQVQIADLIQEYNLSNTDRITFMSAPVAMRDTGFKAVIKEMAECIAEQRSGALLDLKCFDFELLDMDLHSHPDGSKGYLKQAESFHKAITLYLWLSYRFSGVFNSQPLAFHVKSLVEDKIDQCLGEVKWTEKQRRDISKMKKKALQQATIDESVRQDAIGTEHAIEGDASAGTAVKDGSKEAKGSGADLEELANTDDTDLDVEQDTIKLESAPTRTGTDNDEFESEVDDLADSPAADASAPITPDELEQQEAGPRV